jgi:3-phenylpropionate/trans-cinnamate dioxygenase ferredoxin reductase component
MPADREVDVLLIGGGVASVRCARTLRRRKFAGSILIVGDEPAPPYNRPPLSKELLRGEVDFELVAAEPESWYVRQRVDLLTAAPVASLDINARLAVLADGSQLRFDQCLLATGAAPRRPPIPGAEHARLLRTIADARALRDAAAPGREAVIVGGGFIGVEVAGSLAAIGMRVTVLDMAPALWGGVLGEALSGWAAGVLGAAGVSVRTGVRVTALDADAAWIGDERLAADLLVAGVGVAPRVQLAAEAGLAVDDGVVVDERHATTASGVFAAGDVARVAGRRVEHWHAAREGGEAAALAMLDEPPPEQRAPWVYSEFAGHLLDVVGWAPTWDEATPLLDGRLTAYGVDGKVAQLAIVDSAVSVDEARLLIMQRPALAEVEGWVAGATDG